MKKSMFILFLKINFFIKIRQIKLFLAVSLNNNKLVQDVEKNANIL